MNFSEIALPFLYPDPTSYVFFWRDAIIIVKKTDLCWIIKYRLFWGKASRSHTSRAWSLLHLDHLSWLVQDVVVLHHIAPQMVVVCEPGRKSPIQKPALVLLSYMWVCARNRTYIQIILLTVYHLADVAQTIWVCSLNQQHIFLFFISNIAKVSMMVILNNYF